jgi:hypothetical protein
MTPPKNSLYVFRAENWYAVAIPSTQPGENHYRRVSKPKFTGSFTGDQFPVAQKQKLTQRLRCDGTKQSTHRNRMSGR